MKLVLLSALGAIVSPALSSVVARADSGKGKLEPITVKGNAFFAGDKRFYVRGVAYQPGGASDAKDPLLDLKSLKRDVENFKELGINTIRIYTIDNSKSHDEGMKMLDDAGIYLALDANTPKYSLNRETNDTLHRSYNDVYLQNVFATIDAFKDYNNLMLLFSGNEVINHKNNTGAATYIKAITRDMKQYIKKQKIRSIPVGYSAADVAENIEEQALFFNCGSEDERSDFFAFNDYSWCDPSTFTGAGWDKKVKTYEDYSKPIFLSEFGCNTNRRDWNEIASLYHSNMTSVYSGGLAYEYTVEPNGYGLVEVSDGGSIKPNDDFKRLKAAYKKTPEPKDDGNYKKDGKASECPKSSEDWEVKTNDLPAMPKKAEAFLSEGAGKPVGLSGSGSHFAGEASESTNPAGSSNDDSTGSSFGDSSAASGLQTGVGMVLLSAALSAVFLF